MRSGLRKIPFPFEAYINCFYPDKFILFTSGHRLHDFNVGLLNEVPASNTPLNPASYTLCAQYVGEVGRGATVEIPCLNPLVLVTALVVQIPGKNIIQLHVGDFFFGKGYVSFLSDFEPFDSCLSAIKFLMHVGTGCDASHQEVGRCSTRGESQGMYITLISAKK